MTTEFIFQKKLKTIFIGATDSTFWKWVEQKLIATKYKVGRCVAYKTSDIINLLRLSMNGIKPHKINLEKDKFIRAKHIKNNILNIAPSTLRKYVLQGQLNVYQIGGQVFYLENDIKALIKAV